MNLISKIYYDVQREFLYLWGTVEKGLVINSVLLVGVNENHRKEK